MPAIWQSTGLRTSQSAIILATSFTATTTLFTVTGHIWVMGLYVVVTTTMAATGCTIQFAAKVGALTAVTVSNATADLNAMTAGTIVLPNTTFTTTASNNANGVLIAVPITAPPIAFMMSGSGTIYAAMGATPASGAIQAQMLWAPMSPGATVA
jgi:hypothetical protein